MERKTATNTLRRGTAAAPYVMQLGLIFSVLALFTSPVSASCANVNTGADNKPNFSTFQSLGNCQNHCEDDFAFGILQGKKCWCSNIAPHKATETDDKECAVSCPGFPDDDCGDASKGLFAYIELSNHAPSGTATAPSSATSTESSSSSETTSDTKTTAGTSVETISGEPTTITVGPTGTSGADANGVSEKKESGSGLSGGAIAGVVIGAIGGLAVIGALIIMLCWRRRQRSASPDPSVQNVLLDGRNSKGSQMSMMKGMFSDGHSHTLSGASSTNPQRTFTDNRMKTDTVIWPAGRRNSSVSLQDNEDYTRPVLRLTNPD
ncbi:hypothetical protein P168DRAFT_109581 [Aspergillus campestris IBT 28561]|uniref:WSC domain-containing protein n=1 Tax=Aspergillus campestris (strain IBT 28561) TaxID=1392248 RepID=A0A2I1D8Y7_ASPC2|nr:uncharacterized protein P168DRAFT_109581 [Aspergillus campestris IBT 28561]PKY06342.1 hypothetical protein P168DRAFT_109581 [Aspergillus campestris IBT 28561]